MCLISVWVKIIPILSYTFTAQAQLREGRMSTLFTTISSMLKMFNNYCWEISHPTIWVRWKKPKENLVPERISLKRQTELMQANEAKYNRVIKSGWLCFILGLVQNSLEAHVWKVLKFYIKESKHVNPNFNLTLQIMLNLHLELKHQC